MSANICNICGANLIYKDGKWVCPACGAFKTEEISNEEVTLLYNAAQKLRLASFDDAEEAYRDIIAKYPENSEAHWGLVLSKYGIKYEDDYDGKKLPTCYATSIESVLTDKDYLDAVRLCKDKYQKEYYIEQGKVLEKIRVEWLEKASKEPKYDVFLCFKDSDKLNNMERTDDSIEVANLYTHLSSLGYKVFYSRESLRDKVAEKYEPYIYNALNTAAVMIVYGSKIEYFSSVWMKNEWTRYVRRLREGLKIEGSLVIACDGVNPGDLPRPLNQMQVLDARKKTFYGDLEAHIAKIISIARRPKATVERVEISSAIGKKKASIDNQIKTIKVGGGVGKKTPVVIDNAVSVREIGRYEVPALTPDEDTKLKSVNLFLQKELFDNAKKVVDEILEKNKYNGQALLADLLIRYKVKSIDELSDKIEEIEDFSQFNTVIEYNDKDIGEKLIAVIGQKIRLAVANSNYDVAIACLKEIVVYNSAEVLNIRLELRKTATRLLAVSANTAAEIFDVLVNSYQDSETYIEYIQGFVDDCVKNRQFTVAQKYNDKIIELDDGNLKATFSQAFIYVQATSFDDFITLADRFVDFKLFDNAIKHFDEEDTVECFARFRKIVVGLIAGQKSGNAVADWFDFVVKYEFDGRNEFIEETINSLPDIKNLTDRAKLFDRAIMCIDGSDVERHISMRLSFAKKLQTAENFALANKYYKEVIDIEEGNLDALWGIILCNIGALRETDIAQNIENFSYFKELETLLKYCPDMGIRAEYLDKLVNAVLFKSASICNEESINKLAKIFDGIIKYYPEECNEILIKHLQKFADNCKNSSAFSLAEKYYAMVLAIDNMKHEAYWGLLQAKLNCRNNDDLIKQKKTISEFSEFSSAIAAASNDERSADKYASIAKNQIDYWENQKKKDAVKKKRKKKIAFFSSVTAIVLVIAIALVGVFQYIKIEKNFKFVENESGYTIDVGKYYKESNVEIPATYNGKPVTKISDGMFENDTNITTITLSSNITYIGNNAFKNCPNLKQIIFKSASTYSSASADTHSGSYAITTLAVAISKKDPNNNIAFIGESAFYNCTALESIDVSSATTIGRNAFYGCSKLESVSLNDNLTKLADSTFNGCLKLNDLQLPSALTEIGANCFVNCQALENIAIPATTTMVGANILNGCTGLKKIVLEDRSGDLSGFDKDWKSGISDTVELKVGFRISLDYNGATSGNEAATSIVSVGENYTLPVPKKVGYKFVGWYDGIKDANKLTDENGKSVGAYEKYESISAYAIWEANLNEIVFNANGGEGEMDNQKIATDATVALNECLYTKKGYTFAGWGTTANGEVNYSDKADYMMGTNAQYILYAIWTPNDNTLHFESNGGSGKMSDMTIATDSKATLSANAFTKTGYDFIGWAETENGSKVYSDGDSYTMGTENATLYALWTPKTYKITYNLNGGQLAVQNKATYNIETATFTLNNPTKRGYEFKGWSGSNLTGSENQAVSIEIGTYGELTFTANWTAIEYSITYNLNEGTNNSANPKTYTIEQEVRLQDPERKGYKFSGWTDNGLISKDSIGEKTFTASWEIIEYNVIYNLEGGTNDSSNPTKYNVNTPKITLKAPTKLGYKFIEWTNGGIIENGSTGDKSFTAKWEIVTYKITYNLDGGTNNKNNPETYNVHDNITLAEPIKTGYKFIGWSDNGKIPVNSTGDKVFTANWEIIGYKITYVLNGGTNSESNKDYYNVENEEIILAEPTRAGYTFNGWSDNGRIPAHSTGDTEFVASWTANQNTLKFNANGGNGGEMPVVTLSTDEEYKLPKNALTRYGYTFAGWSTKADGAVEFEDESVYTMGADSEVTLYAIWSPITYKITYELNGGETENITEYSIETGEFSLSAPTRAGYTFTGWSGSNLTGEDNLTVTIADGTYGALSFVAHWQANENTLVFDANGGIGSMESQKGVTDSTLILNANAFTRKGYDFDGWSTMKDGEKQYADESVYVMGTSSTNTLYAVWTPHLNTLVFNGNVSTSGSMNNMNIHSGETKPLDKNTYEKQGYTFIGWAETANGNVVYTDCANYTMGVEPTVTLYAVWKANEYTISMNPQNDSSVTTQKVTYDESYTLSVPTRVGYTFDGWFTEVGGNGTRLTDADGNSIANWTVADNVTVYAKWLGTEGLLYSANGSEYVVNGVSDKTITEAYIPEYYNGKLVTAIGENAFSGCDKLTAVFMENTIETIGKGAFSGCSALTHLVVPFVGESRAATQEKGLLTYWFGQNSADNTEEIYQYYLDADGFDVAVSAYVPLSLNSISLTDTDRIPFGAFAYMSMLTEVNLGNIVSIENRAFEYANGFTMIELPDTLEVMGNSAFAHTALRSIVIPNSVTEIGIDILQGCAELTDITIPFVGKAIAAIGTEAYLGYLFGNKSFSGTAEVKQNGTSFYIPEKLSSVTVTMASSISEYAFSNIKSLRTVTLPESLTAIEAYLFYGCSNLDSIVLPDSVLSIGDYAFYGCSKLSAIEMSNVQEIGKYAYQNCSSLKLVSFGAFVKTIGTYAFSGTKLRTVDLPSTIESIGAYAFNGSGDLRTIIVRNTNTALTYTTNMFGGCSTYVKVFVADSLLASYKSKWSTLNSANIYSLSTIKTNGMAIDGNVLIRYFGANESVTIPSNVNSILPYAFYGCQDLRTILIPGTVETIGDHSIYNCTSLESVRILPGVKYISTYAFANCANLSNVSLPNTILTIGTYAFSNCESLTTITLPNKLTSIDNYAFNNCTALTEIEIPNSVTSLGYAVFKGCSALEEMSLPYAGKTNASNVASTTAYDINSSFTQSGNEWVINVSGGTLVFTAKEKITVNFSIRAAYGSVRVYKNDSSDYSYYNSSYTAKSFSASLKNGETLKFVFYRSSSSSDKGYVAFDSVVYSSDSTFGSLFGTASYTGGKAVDQNGTKYYIPSGIKKVTITKQDRIPAYAFANCDTIEEITLSNNATIIENNAFYGCSALKSMILPSSVTEVGNYAFYGCSNMASITLSNLTKINDYTFYNCSSLAGVTLPETLTEIGKYVFYGSGLEKITIPNNVTSIGGYVFANCKALTSIILSSELDSIGTYAFSNCESLTTITLPNKLVTIDSYAFNNCSLLTKIVVPNSVTSLGYAVFKGCSALEEMSLPYTGRTNESKQASETAYTITGSFTQSGNEWKTSTRNSTFTFTAKERVTVKFSCKVTSTSYSSVMHVYRNGSSNVTMYFNQTSYEQATLTLAAGETIKFEFYKSSGGDGTYYCGFVKFDSVVYAGDSVFGSLFGTTSYTGSASIDQNGTKYYIPSGIKKVTITKQDRIPAYAFANCDFIEEITLSDNTSAIENNAFYGCSALKSMILPSSVAEVGSYAFYGCSNMVSITLSNLTKINDYTFYNCSSLTGVTLPETLTEIGKYVFYGSGLEQITVPNNVTNIGNLAFARCSYLSNVVLSSELNSLGDSVFSDCVSLATIELPSKLTEIGSSAFNNCTALTKIVVPNSVTSLGYAVFKGCSALEEMSLPYTGRTNESKQASETAYTITGSFTQSGNEWKTSTRNSTFTFTAKERVTVKFSCKVTSTSYSSVMHVYRNGSSNVTMYFNQTSYEQATLTLAAGETIKFEFYKSSGGDGTYYCGFVRFDSVVYAGDSVFGTLFGTTSYTGSKSVDQNGTKYYIPSGIKKVTITKQDRIPAYAFANCYFIEEITLSDNTSAIENNAFYGCSVLKTMVLPSSVTEVGSYAFYGCRNMMSITLPNIAKINDYTFYNCSSLTGVTLPETLTEIGNYAFYGSGLEEITIPNTVTSIGGCVFANCKALISVTLPQLITIIKSSTFSGCEKLEGVIIPDDVSIIENNAFLNCKSIVTIDLSENVKSIGDNAFKGCSNLKTIIIRNGDISALTTLGSNAIASTHSSLCIIVPQDALKAYKEAANWSSYASKIFADNNIVGNAFLVVDGVLKQYIGNDETVNIPANITSIGNYAFAYSNVKNVTIGNDVTTIGQYAFAYCVGLQTVTIGDSVTDIGDYAFYSCLTLESVTYGTGLSTIGNYAFAECADLSQINSTDNGVFSLNGGTLKKIGKMAFNNDNKATKIIVGKSVETIELGAFNGCNNLASIELPFIGIDRGSAYSQSQVFGYIFGYETSNKEGTTMQYTNYYYYIPASLREVVITDETVVSKNAFINCSMLESIIIKSDLTSIGDYAFYNCSGLKTITIESNTLPTISTYVFNGDSNVVIKVNSAILSDYQSDANWSKRTLEAIQ